MNKGMEMPGEYVRAKKHEQMVVVFAGRKMAPECSYAAVPNKKLGSELWGVAQPHGPAWTADCRTAP